jgi:hypothetical protein
MRPSQLWAAVVVAVSLGVTVAGCSGGPDNDLRSSGRIVGGVAVR